MYTNEIKVIHTVDPKMKNILQMAENVASAKASVLISGESGTGKELLARYIHSKSPRAGKAFVAINCAALPDGLLESELFGYERGAFTGAMQRKLGKFEIASGSTFLLDEISELPLILQSKLLRVIQEGEVERLGATHPVNVDVRLIATTNKNLAGMVSKGEFREDLFYRLNVIPIEVPALRDRPRDLEMLSSLFVDVTCAENGLHKKILSPEAVDFIRSQVWPGNIRELKNTIERSVLLAEHAILTARDILVQSTNNEKIAQNILTPGMTVAEVERQLILKTLEHTQQNRTKAAALLGISIRTLRNKINEYKEASVL